MATTNMILTDVTNALKVHYLPYLNNMLTTTANPLVEKISKGKLMTADEIIQTAPYGINGGYGAGTEGGSTPTAYGQMRKRFKSRAKDMYLEMKISHKTVELANGGGAVVDVLKDEMNSADTAIRWHYGRMLFGDGTAKCGNFTGALDSAYAITLDSVKKCKIGMAIDVYDVNDTIVTKKTTIPPRIIAIDTASKTITLDSAVTTTYGGFITVQNSYNSEITGLGAIFDTVNVPMLYGETRSTSTWLNPISFSAAHNLSDKTLYDAIKNAADERNTNIDMIFMSDSAFDAWWQFTMLNNYGIKPESLDFKCGAVGFKVVQGQKQAVIVQEDLVPDGEIWCIDSKQLKFYDSGWGFVDKNTGGIFTLVDNKSEYRGLMANYGELMCDNPGGFVKITDANVGEKKAVTGVSVSPTTKTLSTVSATQQLTPTVTPSDASVTQVRYASSNPNVITVTDNGLIGVKSGTTSASNGTYIVSCTTLDGGFAGFCTVSLNLS